MVWLVTGVKS